MSKGTRLAVVALVVLVAVLGLMLGGGAVQRWLLALHGAH